MLGHDVKVKLHSPDQEISGELRRQSSEGIWLYYGWAEQAALHFFPQHRIVEITNIGMRHR